MKDNPTLMNSNANELLSVLDCVLGKEQATYISIPITTGFRFLDWYGTEGRYIKSEKEYDNLHFEKVIQKNIDSAAPFIEHIRNDKNRIVVEPTKLIVDSWAQTDYHDFWVSLIKRFIKESFFTTGWHLSKGCTVEFLNAKRKHIPTYDMDGLEISINEGRALIESTIIEYSKLGLGTDFFSDVLSKLENQIFVK